MLCWGRVGNGECFRALGSASLHLLMSTRYTLTQDTQHFIEGLLNVRHGAYIGKIIRILLLAICCLNSLLFWDLSYHQVGLGLNSGFKEVALDQLLALSGLWSLLICRKIFGLFYSAVNGSGGSQKAWAVQTHHISKKALALGQLQKDNLYVFRISCMISLCWQCEGFGSSWNSLTSGWWWWWSVVCLTKLSHMSSPNVYDWPPLKPWAPGRSWASPVGSSSVLSHAIARRMKYVHTIPLGEYSWKLLLDLSWTLPFAEYNLHCSL